MKALIVQDAQELSADAALPAPFIAMSATNVPVGQDEANTWCDREKAANFT
jgi:hypothetical protein